MIHKLVDVNDPVLRAKAKPIKKLDKKIKDLISDMKETLKSQDDPEGVGLAAPQIGKSLQMFLINNEGVEEIVMNPKIINIKKSKSKSKKKKKDNLLEGCLSLPHFYGPLVRHPEITIEFMNEQGEEVTKTYKDFFAQIVQHEIDHLNGILFIDHILDQKKPLYKVDGEEWEEVDLI